MPQVCLPHGADQFLDAAAIARAGAGLQLDADVEGDDVAAAVGRLLAEPSFRSAAASVAAEIARMPDPDQVAGVLERLPG